MRYSLKYTKTFKKQIDRLKKKDKALMEELMKKVKKLQDVPHSGKLLKYQLSYYRYRSLRIKKKYRLVYVVDENENTVILVAFGHREEIYKLMLLSFEEERKE
ncbi:MAG: type II toxin-antitoxin system RelE/ParE family toxin [Halobacteriota archaeon]|nr:type II toxin-antitoxin system RelE/ParE family toxin [Halobacteriota archaeon]